MIVRHGMQADPVVIGSDTLVSEAKRILDQIKDEIRTTAAARVP